MVFVTTFRRAEESVTQRSIDRHHGALSRFSRKIPLQDADVFPNAKSGCTSERLLLNSSETALTSITK
jgi:hypothetical protein